MFGQMWCSEWRVEGGRENGLEEDLTAFMSEVFQLEEPGLNIMDILETMMSPDAGGQNAVARNQAACAAAPGKKRKSELFCFVIARA